MFVIENQSCFLLRPITRFLLILMIIAIQGEAGSFSHEAALAMVPNCIVLPCARSAEVFDRVLKKKAEAAVIPIENTLAGPVTEHFDIG